MTSTNSPLPTKPKKYVPPSITGSSWRPIGKALKAFQKEPRDSPRDVLSFIEKYSELYDIVETQTMLRGAKYLASNSAQNAMTVAGYALRVTLPAFRARQRLFKQLNASEHFQALPPEHDHMKRIIAKEIAYKSDLVSKAIEYLKVLSYSRKMGGLRVDHGGQALSLKKAAVFLQNKDQSVRQEVWERISAVVSKESNNINKIFDSVRWMREKRAKAAGFETCRDYYHVTKGRFDYTPEDCFKFHASVESEVVPLVKQLNEAKRAALDVDVLKPWDKKIEIGEIEKPYATPGELVDKMVDAFSRVRPEYGTTLGMMRDAGFIDHENRKGKIPGAMSIPLADHACGFIIANTVGVEDDVRTLAHEGGHSVHWAAAAGVPYAPYKEMLLFPMEVAEVGSMAMVFLVLDHLAEFFPDAAQLAAFKRRTLDDAIRFFPWCMTIDAFQQWIYTNPNHTVQERMDHFKGLVDRFDAATGIDYTGFEKHESSLWFLQGHVFQSPFYYIEYGIAQLAALAIYRNLKNNREATVEQYHDFLKLGNSRPLPELYKAAGVRFDFSREYIHDIVEFVKKEINAISE